MNLLQKLCHLITKHKYRKYMGSSIGLPMPEYHYNCKICGYRFWNYSKPKTKGGK